MSGGVAPILFRAAEAEDAEEPTAGVRDSLADSGAASDVAVGIVVNVTDAAACDVLLLIVSFRSGIAFRIVTPSRRGAGGGNATLLRAGGNTGGLAPPKLIRLADPSCTERLGRIATGAD